jgi:predicted alpha/beta-hydrolase family hydrolase
VERITLKTSRGADVPAVFHFPGTPRKRPVLVLCPGRAYGMEQPFFVELARRAAECGMAAVRFNWAYVADGGSPSTGGRLEDEDLEAVIAGVKLHERIDPGRVILVGKSLGSTVAWRAAARGQALAAALVTSLMADDDAIDRAYPGLDDAAVPVLVVGGKGDPYMAAAGRVALRTPPRVTTVVLGGDHGLSERNEDDAYLPAYVAQVMAWAEDVITQAGRRR